jgi:hypothetical protein
MTKGIFMGALAVVYWGCAYYIHFNLLALAVYLAILYLFLYTFEKSTIEDHKK